jgi:RNA-directed DNA polymerase
MYSHLDLIKNISSDLGMLPSHVNIIAKTAPLRYKVFEIEKKSGGMREVAQPAREVKAIQRWMNKLGDSLPVHAAATAYKKGCSILINAEQHAQSRFMLKLDFTNFFPSIIRSDIEKHLEIHCPDQFDASARKLIAHICCWARKRAPPLRLCIGAPISPMISNSILFEFDRTLNDIAEKDGVVYSRYADDLTLSCRDRGVIDRYEKLVEKLLADLAYPRLSLNKDKTVFASRAGKRVITGLVITPAGGVSIGRDRKRLIRAMYHRSLHQQLSNKEIEELEGLISFADSIEPGFSEKLVRSVRP